MAVEPSATFSIIAEPFDRDIYAYGAPSAFPPGRDVPATQLLIATEWAEAANDETIHNIVKSITDDFRAMAVRNGASVEHAFVYPNYAEPDTPLEKIYGDNLRRLREIRTRYDPGDVMTLAGGWKL